MTKTTQTRQPFLTPAARSRPQLFCRSTSDGSLLWAADDGLPLQSSSDLRIQFPESCGTFEQSGGNIQASSGSARSVFVHEYGGMVLCITRAGDLLTFDSSGNALAVRRGVLGPVFYGAIGAANRTVWASLGRDDGLQDLVAVDVLNGIQSSTKAIGLAFGRQLIQSDGSIHLQLDESTLVSLRPNGSFKWGPFNYSGDRDLFEYPNDPTNGYWGSFSNGDMVTSRGVISAATGAVLADWPVGNDYNLEQSTEPRLPNIAIPWNEKVLAFTWHKEWAEGFGPDDGHWINWLHATEYDRNLNVVADREIEPKYWSEFWTDKFIVPPQWFLHDMEFVVPAGGEGRTLLNYYLNTESLVGGWLDQISLPTPVAISDIQGFPEANKKRLNLNGPDYIPDHPFILRHTGGFFCTLTGPRLASFNSAGQLRWSVTLPNGPQVGVSIYAISDDGSKIYYVN